MLKNDINSKLNVHYVNKLCAISSQGISNELNIMYLMANNRKNNIHFIGKLNLIQRNNMRYFFICPVSPVTQTNGKVCAKSADEKGFFFIVDRQTIQ